MEWQAHPNFSLQEAKKVLTIGEARYNEIRLREAVDWIETHPTRFFKLCVQRFIAFWIPPAATDSYTLVGPGRWNGSLSIR